jgi:hypothetical protein
MTPRPGERSRTARVIAGSRSRSPMALYGNSHRVQPGPDQVGDDAGTPFAVLVIPVDGSLAIKGRR